MLTLCPRAGAVQQIEKDALRDSVKGDVVSDFLPLVDNFELASKQLKLETEAEKKIDASYQVRRLPSHHSPN
jgi:molecular chaperone GrpE (heat shock protein)